MTETDWGQGLLPQAKNTRGHQKLQEKHAAEPPTEPPQGADPTHTFIADFWALKLWENEFLLLKTTWICGDLLQQPQETDTKLFQPGTLYISSQNPANNHWKQPLDTKSQLALNRNANNFALQTPEGKGEHNRTCAFLKDFAITAQESYTLV